ncbi:DUF6931 family protein [Sphingomonas sp.]|uniref:DUF6931 family protein n=1 Tax=Sphingomonas sp. TaxID=28214 RepID=UPI002DD61A91|nr:hypothetical protein [Sphingomonas sp.]
MTDWTIVRLSNARQVAELMEMDEDALPGEDVAAPAYYAALRDGGEQVSALDFLAHALPRFESVAWAAQTLDTESRTRTLPVRDRLALDTVLRWVGEPVEANRLAAREASEAAGDRSAERLLALAVFFSGGTMSQPDLPPVNPPPHVSARFAAGAIKLAAFRTDDPKKVIDDALVLGEAVAQQGIGALTPA